LLDQAQQAEAVEPLQIELGWADPGTLGTTGEDVRSKPFIAGLTVVADRQE